MPFTTAHPAIVVPLKKIWPGGLSLTGLMAGSMSPDLLYFLNLSTIHRGFSHSWFGLLFFCLPAGLAFSLAFHWLFKYHFIINLPTPLDKFFSGLAAGSFRPRGSKAWLTLIISVLVGTLSHFFWDSFTHQTGEIAKAVPILTHHVDFLGHKMPFTALAQHLSTLTGFAALVGFLLKGSIIPSPDSSVQPRRSADKVQFWVGTATFSIAFATATVFLTDYFFPNNPVPVVSIWGVSSWSGMFYSIVLYTLIKKILAPETVVAPDISDN